MVWAVAFIVLGFIFLFAGICYLIILPARKRQEKRRTGQVDGVISRLKEKTRSSINDDGIDNSYTVNYYTASYVVEGTTFSIKTKRMYGGKKEGDAVVIC